MIINGLPGNSINANDRGLMYGDGVFRTFLVQQGQALSWTQQYNKLKHDCSLLGIECPSMQLLSSELSMLMDNNVDGVAKIIITRGAGHRGYAPTSKPIPTRILSLSPLPDYPETNASHGIKVHLCRLKLAHQPLLAGIKHLNRLENVIAAAEWNEQNIAEGIMQDEKGLIIEGTRSNLFMVQNGKLYTPDLSQCGVAGLQRDRIFALAKKNNIECTITEISLQDLMAADEVFLVNSVIGLWPVNEMPGYRRSEFPVSLKIQKWLSNELD